VPQGLRSLVAFAALALTLLLWAEDADARSDGELSAASVATPALILAANDHPVMGQVLSPTASPAPSPGSLGGLFSRHGLMGGFAAGFLGAGLLGLMFGHGAIGELGSVASFFAMLCRLIWSWWTGRNQPAFSGLSPRQLADPYLRTRHEPALGLDPSTDSADDSSADGQHSASA
jgi:predicted lipid-binding transport protein (Tim44 family)